MEAQELKIGNLVTVDNPEYHPKLKGLVLEVIGLNPAKGFDNEDTYSVTLRRWINDKVYETYSQLLDFVKPIALTEEWLMTFGFFKNNNAWVLEKPKTYKFHFSIWNDLSYNTGEIPPPLDHVHQLQNLYVALEGKELTIK